MSDETEKGKDKGDGKHFKAGIAVGIGSAAIVAALLYARSGKPKAAKPTKVPPTD